MHASLQLQLQLQLQHHSICSHVHAIGNKKYDKLKERFIDDIIHAERIR